MSRLGMLFGAGVTFLVVGAVLAREGKVLYEKDSEYNHIVVIEDDEGLRSLLFEEDGALQSVVKVGDPDHLELPYARGMFTALAFLPEPKRILIVGLGGGTIPGFLHKHCPGAHIDVVDIDPDVVKVAKKYFGFREDEKMKAHVADGRKFIEDCRKPYDIIFLDAYSAENIPRHLATREFLQAVRKALTPKGIVVGNVWSRYSNPLYDSMVRTYHEVFDELYLFDIMGSGNKIFVGLPREEKLGARELTARARAISRKGRFRFDLGEIVAYGFRRPGHVELQADILMDAVSSRSTGKSRKTR